MGIWGKSMHVESSLPALRSKAGRVHPPPEGYKRKKSRTEWRRYQIRRRQTSPSASCRLMIWPASWHTSRTGTRARRCQTRCAVAISLSRRPAGTPIVMVCVSSMNPRSWRVHVMSMWSFAGASTHPKERMIRKMPSMRFWSRC